MSADISLFDLVNQSIGSPEIGAVNFTALHSLLHAIIGHLKIQNVTTKWREEAAPPNEPSSTTTRSSLREVSSPYQHIEDKLRNIETQIAVFEKLPSGTDLLDRTSPTATPVSDMWQMMQIRRLVQTSEDGVSKTMVLIQDLLREIQDLRASRDNLMKQVKHLQKTLKEMKIGELSERVVAMENCCHRVENLEAAMKFLEERLQHSPDPDGQDQCVTWADMQLTLVSEREKHPKGIMGVGTMSDIGSAGMTRPSPSPPTTSPQSWASPSIPSPLSRTSPIQKVSPNADVYTGGATTNIATPKFCQDDLKPPNIPSKDTLQEEGWPLTRVASGAERYPKTVEALKDIGKLKERHDNLEARVGLLEAGTVGQGERDLPDHLVAQLNEIQSVLDSLTADRNKLKELETMTISLRSSDIESGPDQVSNQTSQLQMQIALLRRSVQTLEEQVQKLKAGDKLVKPERKAMADSHLQEQLDNLRGMLTDMMASSSSMLTRSLQEDAGQGRPQSQGERQASESDGTASCPSCCVDVSKRVSQLFQRYEKLQGLLTEVQNQRSGRRLASDGESSGLIDDVQTAIQQLQRECEKLHSTTDLLVEQHSQKQTHIDHLYKSMEQLEKNKADKELVEMEIDIKADKRALDTKVSRLQFDSMTEQLNTMFQELLSKITGQEQDWHNVIEKISSEMECKLNRIELDPLKTQLEDRWGKIRKMLQAQPAPDHDDAAGFRKQLVARFHCISCDRPVDMQTPGPHMVAIPTAPALPSHKSNRPYTVYELEQVRQHCRTLRPGTNHINFEMASSERTIAHVRRIHTIMCKQIDTVQSQLLLLERPFSHGGGREIGLCPYPSMLNPLHRIKHSQSLSKHSERFSEMSDYNYLAMSRSCGGSHTVTYPSRRLSRLQNMTHIPLMEDDTLPVSPPTPRVQPEEVDILGLDGHIYKGRVNSQAVRNIVSRLPNISSKEGMCKSKEKVSRAQSQTYACGESRRTTPVRPQSAKTSSHHSVSISPVQDRSSSSAGSLTQRPLPVEASEEVKPAELQVDPTEAVEEPISTL